MPKHEKEWEPSVALREALGGLTLVPGATLDGDLAGLEPHLREALEALGRLERQRDLSETERVRAETLRMLLASVERVRR